MTDPATSAVIQPLIDASKIDVNPAKTVTYRRVATTRLREMKSCPCLGLVGPSGSGKSTIERALKQMDEASSYSFSCSGISAPAARDELAKAFNQVAIAEEFDLMKDQLAASTYFQARCDRETSAIAFKERTTDNGPFKAKTVEIFGATVLHARNALADPGLTSRMLVIHTRHRPGPYPEFHIPDDAFFHLVSLVDWSQPPGVLANGRLYDTWLPVLKVAAGLGDQEYLDWAGLQIRMQQQRLEEAAGYDHRQVILAGLVAVLAHREADPQDYQVWSRINVNEYIGLPMNRSSPVRITPLEVGNTLRDLGFTTKRVGGELWLYPTPVSVILAAQDSGYEDEWVAGLVDQVNLKLG